MGGCTNRIYKKFLVYEIVEFFHGVLLHFKLAYHATTILLSLSSPFCCMVTERRENKLLSFMSRISLSAFTFPIRSPLRNLYSVTFQITELLCCILNQIASARSSFMLLLEEYVFKSSMVTFIYCITKKWGKKKPLLPI